MGYEYNKYKKETRKLGNEESRKFPGKLKPLMTEVEKSASRVPIEVLAYDFSCRITRLYKWLNEGRLSKADRDVIGAYGLQMLRSASSISANLNEAKHPQSDADYLSKVSIALKEARETNHWLDLLHDNGYLDENQFASLDHDIDRILRILVTVTTKVRERLRAEHGKLGTREAGI